MFNPFITAAAGWSEAVEERAKRLLRFTVGTEGDGMPITVATMFARCHLDPVHSARLLMIVPPLVAQQELTGIVVRFRIDGEACQDPSGLACAALSHAGRAVTTYELHPERQWLANLLSMLLGVVRQFR